MAGIRLFGDWEKAARILNGASERYAKAVERALLKEGHYLRGKIVAGIASGAPGGKAYLPLSPLTLAVRSQSGFGGTKPMNVTGAFRAGVVVVKEGSGLSASVFIGIKRGTRTKDGKDLLNLAELHEFGKTYTYQMTAKQRRFLFAMLRAAGTVSKGGGGSGGTTVTIPARPTFGPSFEAYAKPEDVRKRLLANIADGMGGDFGTPG